MAKKTISIPSVTNDGKGRSFFGTRYIKLSGSLDRMLSEQQQALNFRLRTSASPYESDWHVAGDPTLLIILGGAVEIELRNGSSKTFRAGDMFAAQDYLANSESFSDLMGHRARTLGNEELRVLHLKLATL